MSKKVYQSINEKTEDIQPLIGLNPTFIQYSSTYEGMAEHEPLMKEIDKILKIMKL